MSSIQPGSWSDFTFSIPHDARKVFDAAMHGLVGVDYKPIAVATQVVAGTNYCFLCEATPIYPSATPYAAKVYLYQPLHGHHPHLVQIIHDKP
ncbi:MAG TPA: hypothetical protein VHN14_06895 [Kofleriaceae bacterium]|nr:hypothetical protein [Kofleriaceae bacterium]